MGKKITLVSVLAILLMPVAAQAGSVPNAAVPAYAAPAETVLGRHIDTRGITQTTGVSYVNGNLEHRHRVARSPARSWHTQIQQEAAYAEKAMARGDSRAACKAISRAVSLEEVYNKGRHDRPVTERYMVLKEEYCA